MSDYNLPEIRTAVDAILKDTAGYLSTPEKNENINAAIRELSHDRPQIVPKDISGDGSQDYALPSEFIKDFSEVEMVEVPAGSSPPEYKVRDDDWFLYEDPTKAAGLQLRLRFKVTTPGSTETIRVIIRTPHAVTKTTSTLNQTTFQAIVFKTLALNYKALASRYSQTNDPTIAADAVDYGGRSQNYLFLAERAEAAYKKLSLIGGDTAAGQAMIDVDVVFGHGEDMLWHPKRSR